MYTVGDYVRIKNTNLVGSVVRINRKQYTVSINDKLVTVTDNSLESEKNYVPRTNFKAKVKYDIDLNPNFNNEIMLRHKTREESIYELDKFIDSAIINKVTIIRIIHGKSGGILKEAVHEYLRNNKNIESFKLAGYFDGQFGVTIANLK